jgi:CDP-paratose 2-epimerase
MKILVTGGMGFIGSHIAEHHAMQGDQVVVIDNLSRGKLLPAASANRELNRNHLLGYANILHINADIRDKATVTEAAKGCDIIFHAAGQTAVTTSMQNPEDDFSCNVVGTFNILEAARLNGVSTVVYCSTNKVYGANVNNVGILEGDTRYSFENGYNRGISENFPIDLCEHTPYGCSKLTGDLYCQEYARCYGIRTAVFRMSCIYGTRQFGIEDQGWVTWLTHATLNDIPLVIYGDGKQVRDLLFISDLVDLYDKFLLSDMKHGVFNIGGGTDFSVSILELLDLLHGITGKRAPLTFSSWRHSDQKIYISDISKAAHQLGWKPRISPTAGLAKLVEFMTGNELSR